jgi:hypothetical protein
LMFAMLISQAARSSYYFIAVEERVIGVNESRAVYQDFIKNTLDEIVPVKLRKLSGISPREYFRLISTASPENPLHFFLINSQ